MSKADMKSLKETVAKLERRIELLEAEKAVREKVTERLQKEVDRLDQYGRRHNIVIRNVELPSEETIEEVEVKVANIVENSLKSPDLAKDIDKTHRIGRVKTRDGKSYQNIVVRFKTHQSRYKTYQKRKQLVNGVKIGPHLTRHRGSVLHESIDFVKDINGVEFTYANIHGDLRVRLTNEYDGKNDFQFTSIQELNQMLVEKELLVKDDEE